MLQEFQQNDQFWHNLLERKAPFPQVDVNAHLIEFAQRLTFLEQRPILVGPIAPITDGNHPSQELFEACVK